jgi:N-acyl-phosphatidylethanolamine-hydrolysing phospholipase D
MNPAEAAQAHFDLGSRLSVACHWATFRLTDEPPEEPPVLLAHEKEVRQIEPRTFVTMRIGERIAV